MTHKYFNKNLRRTLMATTIAAPGLLFAGNIPQYQVSRGTNTYAEFTDGTPISCSWNIGEYGIYPGGKEYVNPCSSEGFPIGFDFRYAGTTVNQFAVSSYGQLYLGKDQVRWGSDVMVVGMYPTKNGLSSGNISYKTTGAEGNHVFHLQLKEAVLNESGSYIGRYNLQYRLFEADGKIEFAFSEEETGYQTSFGLFTGIWGLNNKDAILLTASGLNPSFDFSIAESTSTNILMNPNSYIVWNRDDFDHYYQNVFVFTAPVDTPAPAEAPRKLAAIEDGANLNISCARAEGADATVILYSNEPFSSADYPVDGESFVAGKTTKFGNATAIYYGNDESPAVTLNFISPDLIYYIEAISVNGYPNYNISNTASLKFTPSQAPPASFVATPKDAKTINLSWESDYPVIIAATSEKRPGYMVGYQGDFGTPSANSQIGDVIEGGGKVIYVGDANECAANVNPNELTFFRAWSVSDGKISATASDIQGLPAVSMPYEPKLETYPTYIDIYGWIAESSNKNLTAYLPVTREYYTEESVMAVSVNNAKVKLTSPELPLGVAATKVSFEYALETVLPPNAEGVPMGNKPGDFGTGGYLKVNVGGDTYKNIATYEGTMVQTADGYESTSSSFIPLEVELPVIENGGTYSFEFSSKDQSYLYIRNIKVEYIGEVSKAPESAPTNADVDEDKNAYLYFTCDRAEDAEYTLVLFSQQPITSWDYPEDGTILKEGAKSGDAIVLYYGSDEKVSCQTNYDIVIPDFNTTYYFAALSATGNPLYNREHVASVEYTTLKEMGNAKIETVEFNEEEMSVTIKASRHENASSTLILLSEGKFNGTLEDSRKYENGEVVGNAKVLYHDNHESIEHTTDKIESNKTYTLTAVSANERGWWADTHTTTTFNTITSGIENVEMNVENTTIYNVMGIRLNANSIDELPSGIYIVNGQKVVVK